VREQPFGPGMVVWTIDGHMFAAYTETGEGLSLRVPEAEMPTGWPRTGKRKPCTPLSGAGWVLIPWADTARGVAPPDRGLLRAWCWPTGTSPTMGA
jgi:hypothetical protein